MLEIIQCYWLSFMLGWLAGFVMALSFIMIKDYDFGDRDE